MDRKGLLKAELSEISKRRGELEKELKEIKANKDRSPAEAYRMDRIKMDLQVLQNKAKHLLFKLGSYRYPEGKSVEYEPGQYMDANVYHWLKD